jgi:penicillin-binding protein 1A
MTGGSLPAMTWRQIMAYAHQGIEIKPIPGVAPGPTPPAPAIVANANAANANDSPRPTVLSKRGADVLLRVERLMDEAARGLAAGATPGRGAQQGATPAQGAVASASDGDSPTTLRGSIVRGN